MKVSIIIPIYKVEKYITKCIQSVIDQTYADLECILVNDATPDNSYLLAKEFVREKSEKSNVNFLFVEHDRNKGLSEARNTGVKQASGNYVFFLDSDDFLPSTAIENLVRVAEDNNMADVVYGHTVLYNNGHIEDTFESPELMSAYNNHDVFVTNMKNYWPAIACNKLINRSIFIEGEKWFYPGIIHEDVMWCFEISTIINTLIFCPKTTYLYNVSDNDSISRRGSSEKDFRDNITILERKLSYMDKVCAPEELAQNVYNLSYLFYLSLVRLHFSRSFRKECHQRLAAIIKAVKKTGYGPLHTRWYARLAWML